MAALPYMPLYVADYLADAAHLSAAEHGAYLLLLMTYWQRGKPLPSDDLKLSRIARMTPDEWADARDVIAEFFVDDGETWTHGRVERELALVIEKSEKARSAGRASAERRSSARPTPVERPSNGRSTDVQRTFNHTDTDTDTDSSVPSESAAPARKRARRLPADWSPKPEHIEAALALGLPDDRVLGEAQRFRDYWLGVGGDKGRKLDWMATWRNWCRTAVERLPTHRGPHDRPREAHLSAHERSHGHLMSAFGRRAGEARGRLVDEDADDPPPADDWGAGLDLLPLR